MPNVRLRPSGHLTLQVCLLVSFISVLTLADEVRCFCDRLSCPGTSVCTGKWCLVGISTEGGTGHLEQICGWDERDRPLDCEKNWDRWAEVCACDEPLCNTFAYLRTNIDKNAQEEMGLFASDSKKMGNGHSGRRGWYQGGKLIILLVILPLVVGGLAVCLVFVNYHCKMN